MKRDLPVLEARTFDLIIIGGGVLGVAIARDAARRGVSVALVEKNDFASAASEAMSHTIHGGIRYFAQGQFSLVREALKEKAIWLRTAPDFIKDQPFILPLKSGVSALKSKAGIALYQWLSGRRTTFLSAAEAIEREPCLAMPDLAGAAIYHDARIDDPDRLILALLNNAVDHGAAAANHLTCIGLLTSGSKITGVQVIDGLTQSQFLIRAKQVINATGPWAQNMADLFLPGQAQVRLTASKGIHIITPAITKNHAIALSGKGEHGFILPWKGMSLVGTSDDAFTGDAGSAMAGREEIVHLVEKITRLLPSSAPHLANNLGTYAGVRALPGSAENTYRASREVAICDHHADGIEGLHSVYGGKWTTARHIAEQVIDLLASRFNRTLKPCDTSTALIEKKQEPKVVTERLQYAADEEMAVTREDYFRRLGRADAIINPEGRYAVETWLASREIGSDNETGQDIAGERE